MKQWIAITLSAVLLLASAAIAAEPLQKANIALGKPVTGENTHGASYTAKNAVDGTSAIWSSPDGGGDLVIDLLSPYAIETVEIQARQNMDQPFSFPRIYGSETEDFSMFDLLSDWEATVPARGTLSTEIASQKKYRYIKLTFPTYATVDEVRIYEKILEDTGVSSVEVNYSDVKDKKLSNALGLLGGFGILLTNEGAQSFDEDSPVTRAEFADFLVKVIGLDGLNQEQTPFLDIAGIPQENSIKTLYSLKAADEYAAGLFKPAMPITVDDAATMTVKSLGYSEYAKATGKADYIYKSKISELKLLGNTAKSGNLTRKDAAFLLVNALHAKVMDIKAIGNQGIRYAAGKTLLECRGIYWAEGVVTENYCMSYNRTWTDVPEGRVVIEDQTYDVAYSDLLYHVGDKVRYYYQIHENDSRTIVFLHPVHRQTELVIPAENVEVLSQRNVQWYEGERLKTNHIANSARVIYNGRPLSTTSDISHYIPQNGFVRLLDYDGNNAYDTMIIYDYVDRVVKRVNQQENAFYFEAGKAAVKIDGNKTAVFYRNGKIATPLSIIVGDVLSIGTSTDGKHYEIHISSQTKEGKITELVTGEESSVGIGYLKSYPLSKSFNNPSDLRLGERGTLHINYEGKAVFFDTDKFSGYRYGFLTGARMKGGFSDTLLLQMYTDGGTVEVFSVRENAVLDGEVPDSLTEFLTLLEARLKNGAGNYVDCAVRYKINIDLEITELDTLYNNGEQNGFSKLSDINEKYIMYGVFDGKYILDTQTAVFYIYENETTPEERYEVSTVSESFQDRKYYTLSVYGDNSDLLSPLPVAVVREGNNTNAVKPDAYSVLVDSVAKGLNQAEEIVPVIYGMYRGKYQKLPFAGLEDVPNWLSYISFGDIIRIDVNKYNEISVCEFVGEYIQEAPDGTALLNFSSATTSGTGLFSRPFMMMGGAYQMNNGLLLLKPGIDMENTTDFHIVNADKFENVYLCNLKSASIRKASPDEIADYMSVGSEYSYVFCRLFEGYHRDLIIYAR